MKGYTISEDYEMLFELANQGYRIAAWLLYSDAYEPPIFDIVEVKK